MLARTIREIEQRLFHDSEPVSREELALLRRDGRKGVRRLLSRWHKQREKRLLQKRRFAEMSTYERQLWQRGKTDVAGVDEAGRGPLAGPVVAAAVILKNDTPLLGLNDSKQLTENIREKLYEDIVACAQAVAVGVATVDDIDRLNIYEASKQAMMKAIRSLKIEPDHLLIDAVTLPVSLPQTSLVKGDARSVSIAAASIVAKVTRDRMMREMDGKYPYYGFARNVGYGTKEHLLGIERYGVCEEHRKSFAPVKERMNGGKPEVG